MHTTTVYLRRRPHFGWVPYTLVSAILLGACEPAPVDISLERTAGDVAAKIASGLVGQDGKLQTKPQPLEFIPALNIDHSSKLRAFAEDVVALVAAVKEQGGRVFIGLKPETAPRSLESGLSPAMTRAQVLEAHEILAAHGVEIKRTYMSIPIVQATIIPEAVPELRKLPILDYIEPEPRITLVGIPEPQDTSWGAIKVRGPQAWFENQGHDASITFIDSGVDYDHVVTGDGPVRLGPCLFADPFSTCFDDTGHGSHVAGIAAARDDGEGYIGIMNYEGVFGSPVASIKVCGPFPPHWDPHNCDPGAILGALDWTATNGWPRQIVNMSWGSDEPFDGLLTAIVASRNAGNLLVAAAGNDREDNNPPVGYPARYWQVIAVSGTLPDDTFADWILCERELNPDTEGGSVFGPEVEMSAPFWAKSMWLNGQYEVDCGTSMSAPVVSGAAALVWTKNPSWTNDQVRTHLQTTAKDLGAPGRDQFFGFGRVDAGTAVGVPVPSVSIAGPTSIQTRGNYSWTAYASGGVGGYTYEWFRQVDYWWPRGSATCHYQTDWVLVGTGQSYSSYVTMMDYDFRLRVTVHSGVEVDTDEVAVLVGDGSLECPG